MHLEGARLVTVGRLSVGDGSMRLFLPKSSLEKWVRVFKTGKLERIDAHHRPMTDVKIEPARVRREPALDRVERN